MNDHASEIEQGKRFEFGRNWSRFLLVLNETRIEEAKASLRNMLGISRLDGHTFLDVGSGSGLFSLAARMLGARVHSFDFDPKSVACTEELRRRYFERDDNWTVDSGSALDLNFLSQLDRHSIVYSWGVLHHTGAMWNALANVARLVEPGGKLFVSIYNNQGLKSRFWRNVKRVYCSSVFGRISVISVFFSYFALGGAIKDIFLFRNPTTRYLEYKRTRGMSATHDWIDWLGGYPFEVARPEDIVHFYRERGFILERLKTCGGGLGCNEFVFSLPAA